MQGASRAKPYSLPPPKYLDIPRSSPRGPFLFGFLSLIEYATDAGWLSKDVIVVLTDFRAPKAGLQEWLRAYYSLTPHGTKRFCDLMVIDCFLPSSASLG